MILRVLSAFVVQILFLTALLLLSQIIKIKKLACHFDERSEEKSVL